MQLLSSYGNIINFKKIFLLNKDILLVKISKNNNVCHMSWNGSSMLFFISNVHSCIIVQSKKICTTLYLGQFFFRIEVSIINTINNQHKYYFFSLCFLWGPLSFLKHIFSRQRLVLSATYLSTLLGTLYCALHLQSTPFTVLCAFVQIIVLIWAVIDSIPGGTTGLSFISKIFSRSVNSSLPV